MTTFTRATSRAHATRFLQTIRKLAIEQRTARPNAMLSFREHPDTRAHGVMPPARGAKRLRRASFIYSGSLKYSGSALRNLHTSSSFPNFLLSFPSKNQLRVARAATAARCHLRPSLPREPQMTTQTPFPGSITVSPVMDTVDVGFSPSVLSSSLTRSVPPERWNDPATTLPRARPRSF